MNKKETIAIHGSYFGLNFGDTLIISIINNWVKEFRPNAEINLPFVNSSKEANQIVFNENYIKDPSLKNTTALIFGPGGYFGEPNGSFLKRQYWYLRNYKRHLFWNKKLYKKNIPFMIVGVGVGPINNSLMRKTIIKLFKKAQFIAVRDQVSKDYLVDWGIPIETINTTRDVALSIESKQEKRGLRDKRRIGVHFSGNELSKFGKMDEFIAFIKYLIQNYEVVLVEDEPNQTKKLNSGSLYERLKFEKISLPTVNYENPKKLLNDLQMLDAIITSKLHVGILGYSYLIPVLSIPKHKKTRRFYEQINRSEFCLDFQTLEIEFLIKTFEECIASPIMVNKMKDGALLNKKMVGEFLSQL